MSALFKAFIINAKTYFETKNKNRHKQYISNRGADYNFISTKSTYPNPICYK